MGPILSPHCTQGAQGQAVRSNIRRYHKEASCQHQPGPHHSLTRLLERGKDKMVKCVWSGQGRLLLMCGVRAARGRHSSHPVVKDTEAGERT